MKKIKKLVLILFVILLSSGCTKYVQKEGKNVVYQATGQTLTANILCQPEQGDLYNLYKKNEKALSFKLNSLPLCKDYKLQKSEFKDLWDIFVKPLSFIILKLGYLVKNMGLSVMLIGLAIRLVMFPISKKTAAQSETMKLAQPELKKIEKKYKGKTDNESMMAKSQETMQIYKKYKINPVSGCVLSLIQLPLFFAFLEAINRVPAIFEDSFLGMKLGMTPWIGIFNNHNYLFVLLIALIVTSTYFSFKNTMGSQTVGEGNKQMQFMVKFMIVFIGVASLSLPTAIALYWVVTNLFAVGQNYLVKKMGEKRKEK